MVETPGIFGLIRAGAFDVTTVAEQAMAAIRNGVFPKMERFRSWPEPEPNGTVRSMRRTTPWIGAMLLLALGACGNDPGPDDDGNALETDTVTDTGSQDTTPADDATPAEDTFLADDTAGPADTFVPEDTTCTPNCAGLACGDDGCGGTCGTCAAGESCEAGSCAAATACPPPGPYGTGIGDTVADLTLTDCDGNEYSLHELCAKKASYIYLYAGW